ncbi:MAG: hypothetical protein ACRDK9_10370 [Solirubrobacterales bacterium]
MPEPGDRQQILTTLTTEHFTLQGARSQTTFESSARGALYLGAVSSTLIAIGLIANDRETFEIFSLVALPTLYFLGLVTFVRLVESSIEDLIYGRAINRIRHYYVELAGEDSRYFQLGAHDDVIGVVTNMGLRASRFQLFFAMAISIGVVNSVVGGSAVALLASIALDASLGVAAACGAIFALASVALHIRHDRRRHTQASLEHEPLFPSPS